MNNILIWKTDENNFIVRFKQYVTNEELDFFNNNYGQAVECDEDISGDYNTLKNYYNNLVNK